jgi:hypothetical protein
MSGSEDWIAKRAYELWDRAGRPDGRSEEFWFAAKEEVEQKERKREMPPPARPRAQTRRPKTAADRGREPDSGP